MHHTSEYLIFKFDLH